MISDRNKVKMFEMRVRGYTLEAIGKEFGITRERVRQILRSVCSRSTSIKRGCESMIYPNIAKWLMGNDVSVGELSEMLDKSSNRSAVKLSHKLHGKHIRGLAISEIRKILEITGLTFEEAFKLDESALADSKAGGTR